MAEQARVEREDYMHQIQKQKQVELQERKVEEDRKQALIDHSHKIRGQIATNEDVKKQEQYHLQVYVDAIPIVILHLSALLENVALS